MRSTEQGATTQVWLAASDEAMDEYARGRYFVDRGMPKLDDYAQDQQAAQRVWKESEERSGFVFDFTEERVRMSGEELPQGATMEAVAST